MNYEIIYKEKGCLFPKKIKNVTGHHFLNGLTKIKQGECDLRNVFNILFVHTETGKRYYLNMRNIVSVEFSENWYNIIVKNIEQESGGVAKVNN